MKYKWITAQKMTENDHFLMLYYIDSISEEVVFKGLKSEHIIVNENYTALQ